MMTAKDIWVGTKFDEWFKDGTAFILDVQWARSEFFEKLNHMLGNSKKTGKNFNNWFNYRDPEEYEAIIYLIQKDLENGEQTEQFHNMFDSHLPYFKSLYKETKNCYQKLKGDALFAKVMVDVLTWKINPKKSKKS